MRHRRLAATLALAILATEGCGGGATTRPATSGSASAPTAPPPPAFTASLSAPTPTPKANANWVYAIRVRDARGRRLRAAAEIQFLFAGQVVGRDTPPVHRFVGDWRDAIQWPPRSVGYPLTFRAVVRTSLGTRTLDYAVQVRP